MVISNPDREGLQQHHRCILLQEFGRVESSVTTKIKGVTRSHLDEDSEDDPGECDVEVQLINV